MFLDKKSGLIGLTPVVLLTDINLIQHIAIESRYVGSSISRDAVFKYS